MREQPRRTPPRPPDRAAGRVRLDLARGVLMAWAGCDPDEAFTQLVTVAHLHALTVFDLADAVLAATHTHAPDTDPDGDPLIAVVHRCWPQHTDPAGHHL